MNPARAGGFTIVELLIVIAIVGILVGILLPVLARARQAAHRVGCASNLRQIGQTLQIYRGEHRDRFPLAKYMPDPWLSGDPAPAFHRAIARYMETDSSVYRCPGDPVVYDQTWIDEDGEEHVCGMSCQYNTSFVGNRDGEVRGLAFEETWMHRRLSLDSTDAHVMRDFDGGTFETQSGEQIAVPFFHAKRNLLFVDGHVANSIR